MKCNSRLLSLYLRNVRIYDEALFEFSPGINVIVGPNGYGKTTILESIYWLITGRSFRAANAQDLIRFNTESFCIEARFLKNGWEHSLKLQSNGKEKQILYNNTPYPSYTSLIGTLKGTVLSPDDNQIVKGPPTGRRKYLDIQISQTDPLYVYHLSRFEKAMRQRNQLLRISQYASIESWEHEMAHSAAYIILSRSTVLKELEKSCTRVYQELSNYTSRASSLKLSYKSSVRPDQEKIQEYLIQQYKKLRERERVLGMTLTGPHRDDIEILVDDQPARLFASEGQQRSCAASLRFAEWESIDRFGEESPLFLIDDLGLGMDEVRRSKLLNQLSSVSQVFITTSTELPIEANILDLRVFNDSLTVPFRE